MKMGNIFLGLAFFLPTSGYSAWVSSGSVPQPDEVTTDTRKNSDDEEKKVCESDPESEQCKALKSKKKNASE